MMPSIPYFLINNMEQNKTLTINNFKMCAKCNHKRLKGSTNHIQKFGFINGVDNVNWPPYRDSKS